MMFIWVLIPFAALAACQSTDTAALSSVISHMSTAYTGDPNWSSFAAARESHADEYFSTQTFFADGPEFTSSALSVASTAVDPSAAISSIISQSLAAVDEYVSLYIDFVSTQTYLKEDARSGLNSDLRVFTSLVDDATDTGGDNAPSSTTAAPSGSGSASASSSSRMATPRTQTALSTEVVVRTRSPATTPVATSMPAGATAAKTATTGGVAGAPAVNGVVAGAFAGFVAIVGLL